MLYFEFETVLNFYNPGARETGFLTTGTYYKVKDHMLSYASRFKNMKDNSYLATLKFTLFLCCVQCKGHTHFVQSE